ncbi:hypothetical protein DRH13_06140 [Candidatus Woesebacteria bacterium]|nr:MAG: hypothetical protein DRH13_06140 [Candidatus Woesebacteria bacterium]
MSAETKINKFDKARLHCIQVAVDQDFDVESDSQSTSWLIKGVKIARSGKKVTSEDLREFDKHSGAI